MKVRMKVFVSGSRNDKPWPAIGGVIDLPDSEAEHLVHVGMAEPVPEPESEPESEPELPVVETATLPDTGEVSTEPEPEAPAAPEAETRRTRHRR